MRFQIFFAAIAAIAAVALVLAMLKAFYRRLRPGEALIVTSLGGARRVSFTGGMVLPIAHSASLLDITVKPVEVELDGHEALITSDHVKTAIKATFHVRVHPTVQDVLAVAQAVGCERASDPAQVQALFRPRFVEALRTVVHRMTFEELRKQREAVRDRVVELVGRDLSGFVLDDAAIELIDRPANVPADHVGPFR